MEPPCVGEGAVEPFGLAHHPASSRPKHPRCPHGAWGAARAGQARASGTCREPPGAAREEEHGRESMERKSCITRAHVVGQQQSPAMQVIVDGYAKVPPGNVLIVQGMGVVPADGDACVHRNVICGSASGGGEVASLLRAAGSGPPRPLARPAVRLGRNRSRSGPRRARLPRWQSRGQAAGPGGPAAGCVLTDGLLPLAVERNNDEARLLPGACCRGIVVSSSGHCGRPLCRELVRAAASGPLGARWADGRLRHALGRGRFELCRAKDALAPAQAKPNTQAPAASATGVVAPRVARGASAIDARAGRLWPRQAPQARFRTALSSKRPTLGRVHAVCALRAPQAVHSPSRCSRHATQMLPRSQGAAGHAPRAARLRAPGGLRRPAVAQQTPQPRVTSSSGSPAPAQTAQTAGTRRRQQPWRPESQQSCAAAWVPAGSVSAGRICTC